MFPKVLITDNQTVKYWNDQFNKRNSIEIGGRKIEFQKEKKPLL